MFLIKRWGIILLCFALNCTRDKPARFERATSEGMQAMATRPEFLLAIVICTVLVTWWVLSGFPGMSAVCRETNRLTPFRGPFSSLCYRSFLLDPPAESRQPIS
jgi:hypothetical protein